MKRSLVIAAGACLGSRRHPTGVAISPLAAQLATTQAAAVKRAGQVERVQRPRPLHRMIDDPLEIMRLGGGPCRTRTYNQLIKSQLLYQLS